LLFRHIFWNRNGASDRFPPHSLLDSMSQVTIFSLKKKSKDDLSSFTFKIYRETQHGRAEMIFRFPDPMMKS
jgi:hypothetical protein